MSKTMMKPRIDFLMGTINYFQNQDKFILEFSVADQITLDQIQIFHEK